MPSIITHAFVGVAATAALAPKATPRSIWVLAPLVSVLPDLDVLAFRFGIPYGHPFGHRGFFHSLFFGFALSFLLGWLCWRPLSKQKTYGLALLAVITGSHGLLDAFTNGGLGIALLAPFDPSRYFFPWTPIRVSPFSVNAFLGERGLMVIKSEFLWVWVPMLSLLLISVLIRRLRRNKSNKPSQKHI